MKTYTGGCHCGKFRYEFESDLEKVIECNCSHCYKKGLVLTFVPPEQFRMTEGVETELMTYHFNKKVITHAFCDVCGTQSFSWAEKNWDGNKAYAINLRCVDDLDLGALTVTPYNGKDI